MDYRSPLRGPGNEGNEQGRDLLLSLDDISERSTVDQSLFDDIS